MTFPKYPIAIPVIALATASAVLVPGSSAQTQGAETLAVQFHHREAKVSIVDLPPKMTRRRPSESPGDLAVGTARLRNAAGAIVGHSHQSFMVPADAARPRPSSSRQRSCCATARSRCKA